VKWPILALLCSSTVKRAFRRSTWLRHTTKDCRNLVTRLSGPLTTFYFVSCTSASSVSTAWDKWRSQVVGGRGERWIIVGVIIVSRLERFFSVREKTDKRETRNYKAPHSCTHFLQSNRFSFNTSIYVVFPLKSTGRKSDLAGEFATFDVFWACSHQQNQGSTYFPYFA
jgi:hypothetical protein